MELQLSSLVQSYLKSSEPYKSFKNNFALRLYAENLEGYLLAEALSLYKKVYNANMWVICSTEMAAKELCKDLDVTNTPYIFLPSNNKVLYSQWEGSSAEYAQLKALSSLLEKKTTLIITHLRAFVSPLISPTAIKTAQLDLKINELFDPTNLASKLAEGGYYRSPTCTVPGEFSMHGEIFEIFPFENDYPIRIYADWDRIEKINSFDPFNQDTVKTLSNIKVNLIGDQDKKQIGSVKTYLKDDDYFFFIGKERLDNSFHSLTVEAKALYRQEFLINRDALKPNEILFDFPTFYENCNRSTTVIDVQGQMENSYKYNVDGPISFFGNFVMVKEHISQLFANNYSVAIYAGSLLQKNRLTNMLKEFESLVIFEEQISGGFTISEKRVSVLCDHEIFGRRKQVVKALHKTQSSPLDSFVDLNEGDYVVHVNYGVGQFEKIDRLTMGSKERDYIKIIYANDERLFVPIEQANLIQRYIGSEGSKPKVDKLGGQSWETKKSKARKAAEQLAKKLVQLYARRKSSKGYIYSKDTDWQLEFEASFPFDETEDQLVCIEDVKRDMESPLVMDRLICGDVGYGKTEIALRAAFKAVMDGKQVAFLAPTTILAEQHYKTLIERLGNFPVKAAVMSRMVSRKEQKKILENLEKGQLDILVGTHRLLQKDVIFKDLGLLIVDEEQRFGVKDKERVKELKTNIDSLALSATPIPRTLYMSLLKIRDMSLLTTAPMERRPIKTFIKEFDLETIVKAINFEVERGGQVFYLHNRIDTIDEVVSMLQSQLTSSLVDSIHGQMDANSIENKMRTFIGRGSDVLVSTTLIENGIDIPNVNTIIIDRADKYGLSQLYQLRGRVGRSDVDSYAYLFYPNLAAINEVAVKRLKVISEHTSLGSGFKIAMKDMEIRGTGNLLGKEQSGQLSSVGLDMYLRILDEEIARLTKDKKLQEQNEVFLELDYAGFIPDTYIGEATYKFEIYKKIASIKSDVELELLKAELSDRFGPIPEVVNNLLYIAELKIVGRKLNISHLKERNGKVTIEFAKVKDINIDKVMELIRLSNGKVGLDQRQMNVLTLKTEAVSLKDKSLFILETLQRLS